MLIKGTEDLRIQKTIAAIKESFETLICEKDYNDIKVTELCARAKINKKTFYHYYPTLDDLLSEMQMEMSAAYIELVKDYKLPEDAEKVRRSRRAHRKRRLPLLLKILPRQQPRHLRKEHQKQSLSISPAPASNTTSV